MNDQGAQAVLILHDRGLASPVADRGAGQVICVDDAVGIPLFGATFPNVPVPDMWSMQNPVLYSLICVVVILVIFVPLSVNRYKATSK
ncbi:hypothetical protein ONR57_22275 [Hoyosella sp. YIM 151337]|uniref:hypothetical protein n=1 Tax=Hoyosella sp. YIM 151337 TaxID=2992742 RepID=UPI0022359DAF|nr:hypothetical protein [Hoyosella sp. YIM 151337]MCW4356039.1 hypothetical protein [Hoyosella sp. YIM 151337]